MGRLVLGRLSLGDNSCAEQFLSSSATILSSNGILSKRHILSFAADISVHPSCVLVSLILIIFTVSLYQ
jgi:hypothetical protein